MNKHTKTEDGKSVPAKERALRRCYDWAAVLSLALVLTIALLFFVRPAIVQGDSMMPTLQSDNRLFLRCFFYTPDYGDIVVINRDEELPLIKRVIALEGDSIYIDPEAETVYLNGEKLEEPYLSVTTPPCQMKGESVVPKGCVFVMGDNRSDSHDSRYTDIGFVPVEQIIGKAVLRVFPFDKFQVIGLK